MIPFNELKKELLKDPEFKAEYEALEDEFQLASELIRARKRAGLTQKQIAQSMGTTQSAVARMESGRSPSMKSIQRYADAAGCKVKISLIPA